MNQQISNAVTSSNTYITGIKETPVTVAAVEEVQLPSVAGAQGAVEEQRKLQEAAITNLRGKLEELESYAYQVITIFLIHYFS